MGMLSEFCVEKPSASPVSVLAPNWEIRAKRFLFTFCLLLVVFRSASASNLKVLFSSTVVRPGDTLRIEADAMTPDVKARCLFRGKSYRFFPVGPDTQRALIGIPLGAPPGIYRLRIRLESSPGFSAKSFRVEIATRSFAVEEVSFAKPKLALLHLDREESRKIHEVLSALRLDQYWEGVFDLPVSGKRVGDFGVRRLANRKIDRGFHKGYDLKMPSGTPIQASNNGIVAMAYPFKLHGRTVILDHGQGVKTIYLHMKSYAVAPGQKVSKGQVIGAVGSTGLSTAPHVHWGVYVHGVPVDPKAWMETEF